MHLTPHTILILGGCRSGKSRLALQLATELSQGPKGFIATCVPQDAEMHQRVHHHQQERGPEWQTFEVPLNVAAGLRHAAADKDVLLVDCLTLWVSNLLLDNRQDSGLKAEIEALLAVLQQPPCHILLVANEVGMGLVPDTPLGRRFRDLAGFVNQQVAATVQEVYYSLAGIPWRIKPGGREV